MRTRRPPVKVATGRHRPMLAAVLTLSGLLLILNAWLVSQYATGI